MIGNNLSVQSGVQRYIQNLLLHIDPKRYQVDLFVAPCPKGQVSSQPSLEARGVNLILGSDNDKQRPWELAGYLRNHHDYDIVHYHINSKVSALSCIVIKMLCPHAKLIVHSHVVYPPLTFGWRVAHLLYQMTADYFLGCGVEAAKFAFGSRINHRNNFSVACNAVDRSVFFLMTKRVRISGHSMASRMMNAYAVLLDVTTMKKTYCFCWMFFQKCINWIEAGGYF